LTDPAMFPQPDRPTRAVTTLTIRYASIATASPPPAHPFPFQQCQSTNRVETARRSGPRRRGRRLISPSPGQRQRPSDSSCRASRIGTNRLHHRSEPALPGFVVVCQPPHIPMHRRQQKERCERLSGAACCRRGASDK